MSTNVLILSQSDRWHKLEDLGARIVDWAKALEDVEVQVSHDKDILASDKLDAYDACILCITMTELSAEQERGLVDFVAGGKAAFGIHSATVADEGSERYSDLIGGRFTHHSPYHEFGVQIEKEHPITSGIEDFKINDELYVLDRTPQGADVLATALWEEKAQPLIYTKSYGQGRVLYNALGHDEATFDHPDFQKLVIQGLEWTCGLST